jgi:hypothetical protein
MFESNGKGNNQSVAVCSIYDNYDNDNEYHSRYENNTRNAELMTYKITRQPFSYDKSFERGLIVKCKGKARQNLVENCKDKDWDSKAYGASMLEV